MFTEIAKTLNNHALGMVLVFALWILLFDQKAISRLNSKPSIKRSAYVVIIIYYLLIIIEVIQKIHKYMRVV